jgi:recombination protein RecT
MSTEKNTAQAQSTAAPQQAPQQTPQQAPTCGIVALKEQLAAPSTIASFTKLLGKRANAFTSALQTIVSNNTLLSKCSANSIILAAGQIAQMNLSINPSLGLAAIVPFTERKTGACVPQVQIMRDGYVELCQRSGQIAALTNEIVYEGELVYENRFRGEYEFDSTQRISDRVIGYMAYARTITGFEKTVYMTAEQCLAHAKRYSKQFRFGTGLWKDNFDAMALKTVLRLLIKKYLPKSTELLAALDSDQASFTNGEIGNATPQYVDNSAPDVHEVETIDVMEEADTPQEPDATDSADTAPTAKQAPESAK